VLAILCVGFGALLESIGLVLLIPILAIVVDNGRKAGWLWGIAAYFFEFVGASTRFQRLAALLTIFAMLMLLRAVVLAVRDSTLATLQLGFVEAKRSLVTRRLAAARWDVVAKLRHARITHLMGTDIQNIGIAANFLLQCTISLAVLGSQCALSFVLSPILASFAIGLLVAGGIAITFTMRLARNHGHVVANANLALLNSTVQFLGGIKLAVSQNLQDGFVAEYHNMLGKLRSQQLAYLRQITTMRLAATTLLALVAALLVLIGFGVMDVAPSVMIAELLILARMNGPALQIQNGAQQFAASLPAYEKVEELAKELAITEMPSAEVAADIPDGQIALLAVSFSYAGEGEGLSYPALTNVSLMIAPGSFVGVTGPSGAGKTTLADLLVGLFPPQAGEITVGGVALWGGAAAAWRNRVSYVAQDPFLFHDTIRHNLLWVQPEASEHDLWQALELAGVDDLVRQLSQGLDTVVGERGTLVSGGERQRLAIARALLRHPRLLILDEATNAIDIAGEHVLLQRLIAQQPRPTIVMIAHRVESMRLCERILTLDKGHFAEAERPMMRPESVWVDP